MKGYPTAQGYMGHIPDEGYVLFCTEEEYKEYFREHYGN